MRFNENNLIAEAYAKVNEAKKKPSAGLTKKQKSDVAKKARAGKDIGKKGPGFAKMAKAAGGGEKGKKIAAAAMWKSIKRESAGILSAYEGKKLLNESVSSEQYDEIVSIIHDAVNTAARSNPELSREISQVWDVVTNIWADNEMQVYNTLIDEARAESDPMIPKVEKILQKMTEDYGSEDRAIEELSKWDEDEMNEYYSNRVMNEDGDDNIRVRIQVPVEIFWHQDDFNDEQSWQQFKESFDANAKKHLGDNIDFLETEAGENISDAIDRGDFEVIR